MFRSDSYRLSFYASLFGKKIPLILTRLYIGLFLLNTPLSSFAITPEELGILIINGDQLSEQVGMYYKEARGIPDENVVRITMPVSYAVGDNFIRESDFPIVKQQVDNGLPNHIQATLVTWIKPYSVGRPMTWTQQGQALFDNCLMSITSALAYGYNTTFCQNGTNAGSGVYFDSNSKKPWTDYNFRPSMMLGATTFAFAKKLINRGIAADGTYPNGDGYLVKTTDSVRSIRYTDFISLPSAWSFPNGLSLYYLNYEASSQDYISNVNNVLFYFTGKIHVPAIETNRYLPGAVADHLTSFGGDMSSGTQQMKATKWLEAGATGSFGTVDEPGAVLDKFPKASVLIDRYYKGESPLVY